MMRNFGARLVTSGFVSISLLSSAAAVAEAIGPAETESSSLAEVVVTATRRETNLQSTPVSVSAVTSRDMAQLAPHDLGDISIFVPNFSAARVQGFNSASFAIRGVGVNQSNVDLEAPVGVLVDDFVTTSIQTQLLDTFDIASVEVLRGPQGTLFGKNTIGGAVVVHTVKPEMNTSFVEMQGQYGSFNTAVGSAAVNIPMIEDKLAMRVVGTYRFSDGYMRNGASYGPLVGLSPLAPAEFVGLSGRGDGRPVGGDDAANGRIKLLFQPISGLNALFQYEFLRDRAAPPPSVNETPPGDSRFLFNALNTGQSPGNPLDNAGVTDRNTALFYMGHETVNVDGYYLNVDYSMPVGTLTSVTGYRTQLSLLPLNATGIDIVAPNGDQLSLFDAERDDERKTFQQEIRFASSFNGPFNFVAGGFYQHDTVAFCVPQLLGFLDLTGGPSPFGPWNDTPYTLCNAQRSNSVAGFGEGTFKFTDQWSLLAGVRLTEDRKTWQGRQQVFSQQLNGGVDPTLVWQKTGSSLEQADFNKYPAGVITDRYKSTKPTYRATVSYQYTPDLYTYAGYSHGYQAGTFNDQAGSFAPFGNDLGAFRLAAAATKPETADSYEIGVKSELLGRRLRLNLSLFHVKYSDVIEQINEPIVVNGLPNQTTAWLNAASEVANGLEGEAQYLATDNLTFRAVLGLQSPKYTSYNSPGAGYDLAEAPVARSPKTQWTLDGTYKIPFSNGANVKFNGNANYTSRNLATQSLAAADLNTFLNSRLLLDASVTFNSPNELYYVRGVARNISDQYYRTSSQTIGGLWVWSMYGPPRYFGIEAGITFGKH